MANPKKQSFLGGAAVLAGAAAVVKLIGAVYKIPLNNILGQVGKTYFDTAYSIYNVLLTISTAGLPLALRERFRDRCVRLPMVSEARSLNLSNTVAVCVYEALRQAGFPGLQGTGEMAEGPAL